MTQKELSNTPILAIDDPRLAFISNKWSRTVIQPILITLLVAALFTAVLVLTENVLKNSGWLILGWFITFAALEGCVTTLWLNQPQRRLLNHVAYRASEILFLLTLLRLFTWATIGNWPEWANLPNILRSPQQLFLDAPFIWGSILTLLSWDRAVQFSKLFSQLAIDRAEVHYYAQPQGKRSAGDKPVRTNRGDILLSFFRQWIGGAVILAVIVALSSFEIAKFIQDTPALLPRLRLRPELLTFLLIYFLAGLALLSQARLATMNARWLINGIVRAGQVEKTWHRATIWLLGGVALLAAFLPLGSTFAISNTLQTAVNAISAVAGILFTLFSLLIALLLSLFPNSGAEEASEALLQPTALPTPTAIPTPIPSALPPSVVDSGMLFSSLFWGVGIVVGVLAIRFFLRGRGVDGNTAIILHAWHQFQQWLQGAWRGAGKQVKVWQQAVRTRIQTKSEDAQSSQPPWRFIRLNALTPREQVRYFYLSIVRRAANKGVARQKGKTPLEFAQELKESWPDAEGEVDALTNAFLHARYGRSPIKKEDVNPIKKHWQQLKSNLRRR
ncbi:Permease of the drug/metabolite transporter (DMT) superfamily [hydrothermal vent metagenome]|uniref:Permease of the drug/metabolite transporter (DMT) superfamily n=1 Tax=hydrothermal vent metagenome TaxID=652676 RepID=A0A3B0US38_9ZZZZ